MSIVDRIIAYTDGSALGNPGPGGWAFWIHDGCWASGSEKHTTNNRMELQACLEALRFTGPDSIVEIRSDSRYLLDAIAPDRGWIHAWKRKGWKKSDGSQIANVEIFQSIDTLLLLRTTPIFLTWVRGHSGEPGNDRVDELARSAATRAQSGDFSGRRNHS
jgi:ribonuclease HI